MTAAAAQNGSAVHVPDGWLLAADLHRRHPKGSLRSIHRWGSDGRIARVKDAQGRSWFDPEDYERELAAETELDPGQVVALEARRAEVVVHGANDLLKQLMRHNEQTFSPVADATKELFEILRTENQALREQNAKLLQSHLDSLAAREELLSEAHVRELELKRFSASEARKRDALDMVKGPAKVWLTRMVGGMPPGTDTMPAPAGGVAPARALLASLTDDQVVMLMGVPFVREGLIGLLDTDVLSDEQKGFVREALL